MRSFFAGSPTDLQPCQSIGLADRHILVGTNVSSDRPSTTGEPNLPLTLARRLADQRLADRHRPLPTRRRRTCSLANLLARPTAAPSTAPTGEPADMPAEATMPTC